MADPIIDPEMDSHVLSTAMIICHLIVRVSLIHPAFNLRCTPSNSSHHSVQPVPIKYFPSGMPGQHLGTITRLIMLNLPPNPPMKGRKSYISSSSATGVCTAIAVACFEKWASKNCASVPIFSGRCNQRTSQWKGVGTVEFIY